MDAKIIYVVAGGLAAIVVAIVRCFLLANKGRRYQHLESLNSFVKLIQRRGDRLFCTSHSPLVLVDEKGGGNFFNFMEKMGFFVLEKFEKILFCPMCAML